MKKGFTLMEILFVLLVIALVVSFAVPAIRSVRYDIYNSRAKGALRKLAEANRSFYQYTKGSRVQGSFVIDDLKSYSDSCQDIAASGIPGRSQDSDVKQLFVCGFLDWKDFDVPYKFFICGTTDNPAGTTPCVALGGNDSSTVYAAAVAADNRAGAKYQGDYLMSVGTDMQVLDNLE